MKAAQYREMNMDEFHDRLADLQKKKYDLLSQSVTETIENNKGIKNIRRDIARLKTLIREKELQE